MSAIFHRLLPGVTVIERGWLNCNQVVLTSGEANVLIDSGYGRHAAATLQYVEEALSGAPLDRLINTHCHSDHMGGNRALRERYGCRITIPVGEVPNVLPWTAQSCWSEEMDQYAEEFAFDDTMAAGDRFAVGGLEWQALAAPGHDMDALMFYQAEAGLLVTGDALWERGLGFVWPGGQGGGNAFIGAALATLDLIASLDVRTVIPGHGAPFTQVGKALTDARGKLAAFARDPVKNARHVAKVMFIFALLDKGRMARADVSAYIASVPVYGRLCREFLHIGEDDLANLLLRDLSAARALIVDDLFLSPSMKA